MAHTTIVISGPGFDISALGETSTGLSVSISFPTRKDNPKISATLVRELMKDETPYFGPSYHYSLEDVHFEQDHRKPYSLTEIHILCTGVLKSALSLSSLLKELWESHEKANG